jgi:hypothetical protein
MVRETSLTQAGKPPNNSELHLLEPQQVAMIEEALRSVGEYGEIRLIVEKGRLRFLITQKSFDALKWQPGAMSQESK